MTSNKTNEITSKVRDLENLKVIKSITYKNPLIFLLRDYFRENPPNKKSFTIKGLSEEFKVSKTRMYTALCSYRNVSLCYVIDKMIEETEMVLSKGSYLKLDEKELYNKCLSDLHIMGFYLINPSCRGPKGVNWQESSYYQDEEYQNSHCNEGLKRVAKRLGIGSACGFKFFGIDVKKELKYVSGLRKMLEDKSILENDEKKD